MEQGSDLMLAFLSLQISAGSCPKAESRAAQAHGKCRCWHERIIKQGGSGWKEDAFLDFSSVLLSFQKP